MVRLLLGPCVHIAGVTGSSPVPPTIFFNNLGVISFSGQRRGQHSANYADPAKMTNPEIAPAIGVRHSLPTLGGLMLEKITPLYRWVAGPARGASSFQAA